MVFFGNEKGHSQTDKHTTADGLQSPPTNTSVNDYTAYKRLIQDNIDYNHYLTNCQYDIGLVDELINCMLDVICTEGETVRINSEDKNRGMVKSQYLKLDSSDIDYVLEKFKDQRHKITHIHSYIKTMLYNAKNENEHYHTNAVRVDGLVY